MKTLSLLLAITLSLVACKNETKDNRVRSLMLEITTELNNRGNEVFANTLIPWGTEIHGKYHIFYKDSIVKYLGLYPEYREAIKPEILKIDFEEVRAYIAEPDPTLKEYAPYLDSLITIREGTTAEVGNYYMENEFNNHIVHNNIFLTKPIFTNNGFAFIRMDSFNSPESGGGDVFAYMWMDGKWVLVGTVPLYVI